MNEEIINPIVAPKPEICHCKLCEKQRARAIFKIGENGKKIWQWKNLFKMDAMSLIFIIAILFMTIGYIHDTKVCRVIQKDPCKYATTLCKGYVDINTEYNGFQNITLNLSDSQKSMKGG